jgi:hypothetical protein
MSAAGLAPGLCNLWLNTLRNTPFVAPITCIQLHTGQPGAAGTAHPSAVTSRASATFTAGSNGGFSLTGALPIWAMTASETISHISVWSGFESDVSAVFLFSMPLTVPQQVASGDQYSQNSCNLTFLTQAA